MKKHKVWIISVTVFLTQVFSCRQKNVDAKAVQLISHWQKWNSHWQFSKNCIFSNIQLKIVVNTLPPFKKLVKRLTNTEEKNIKHHIT